MMLALKVVATVFATINMRWSFKGFIAEYPNDKISALIGEIIFSAVILTAIWMPS